jgi:hypothetical protein
MAEEEARQLGQTGVVVIGGAAAFSLDVGWQRPGAGRPLATHRHSEEERHRVSEKRLGKRIVNGNCNCRVECGWWVAMSTKRVWGARRVIR